MPQALPLPRPVVSVLLVDGAWPGSDPRLGVDLWVLAGVLWSLRGQQGAGFRGPGRVDRLLRTESVVSGVLVLVEVRRGVGFVSLVFLAEVAGVVTGGWAGARRGPQGRVLAVTPARWGGFDGGRVAR